MAALSLSVPDPAIPLVDVAGLAKRFGGRWAVRDVALTVAAGDLIGLIGANGGGKTTTLRMLAGLLRADEGAGTVLGEAPTARRRRTAARIGYMPQRLSLYPDLTVRENLMFRARAFRLTAPALSVGAAAARHDLGDVIDRRVDTLSGGWARRAQFAATVIHTPDLLLLDEPTAGLDAATRRDIWRWTETLVTNGCGAIVSTHDMSDVVRCATVVPYHAGIAGPQTTPGTFLATHDAATLEDAILTLAGTAA